MMKRIKKVKLTDRKVHVDYLEMLPGGIVVGRSITTTERPAPSLADTMQALAKHVIEICELPDEWRSGLKVTGLLLSWSNKIMGATIVCQKILRRAGAPMRVATPHMLSAPRDGGQDYSMCLSDECVDAIDAVIAETEAFIAGKRAQMNLEL